MRETAEVVRTKEGGEWEFTMVTPNNLEEAIEVYGEEPTFDIFNSGLKIKIQSVAREAFRSGKTREEVDQLVREYRPGTASRKSVKVYALELIQKHALTVSADPDLKAKVQDAFIGNRYRDVVELLEQLEEGE